jgi:hypothetical protein
MGDKSSDDYRKQNAPYRGVAHYFTTFTNVESRLTAITGAFFKFNNKELK